MWSRIWRLTLTVVVLVAVCFVAGLYAGGALFLKLTDGDMSLVSWNTLWEARHLPWNDKRLIYLPWSWCVTAGMTFLPVAFTLISVFFKLNPKTSLHGDARFANSRELRLFEYKGEYENTSR